MSKAEYWQRGESIDYKNTGSSAIEANSVIVLGKRVGVAGMTIQPGETGRDTVSTWTEYTSNRCSCMYLRKIMDRSRSREQP